MTNELLTPKVGQPRKRAIIVDHDPDIRGIHVQWMSQGGIDCLEAGDAETASTMLEHESIDLLITDLNMPGVGGLELLRRIKASHPDIAIVILTGVAETRTAIQAFIDGASNYLVKPVEREELMLQLYRVLESRELQIQRRHYLLQLEAQVLEQSRGVRLAQEETVQRLVTASKFRDTETGAHIKRTGMFSELIARELGWSAELSERLRFAAPMHDIGKLGIPDSILQKPGRLSADEFETMKTHTLIGSVILADSDSPMLRLAQEIAMYHHERWDGTGYPNGIKRKDIPESARIVAVADVFDALSHDRVYRPAFPMDRVLQMMEEGNGTHFDSRVLEAFYVCLPALYKIAEEHPDEDFLDMETSSPIAASPTV
jgi:putative two-component system response regulator